MATKIPKSNAGGTGRGGARAGAGRPPKAPYPLDGTLNSEAYFDPAKFLLAIVNDPAIETRLRVEAAKALLPFTHRRLNWMGKKEVQEIDAKEAGSGKFKASAPPKLVRNYGKPVAPAPHTQNKESK